MAHDGGDDGGPAFPIERTGLDQGGRIVQQSPGMSMRDYFMAHAPGLPARIHEQFMTATKRSGETDLQVYARVIAEWRGWYADAMLVERSKSRGGK